MGTQDYEAIINSLKADVIARGNTITRLEKEAEVLNDKLSKLLTLLQGAVDE